MPQQRNVNTASDKAIILIVLQAIKQDTNFLVRRAAHRYNVSERKLLQRHARMIPQRGCQPKSSKLLKTEEEVVIRHILNLDA